jgi:predicted ester cyclase
VRQKITLKGIRLMIVNGKIVERWDEFDAVGMMQQLGVISMPQPAR